MRLGATSLSATKPGSVRKYAASSSSSGSSNTLPDIDTYSHVRFDHINTGSTANNYAVQSKPDGTKIYTLEFVATSNARLKEQNLSTAFDISTHGSTTSSMDTNTVQSNFSYCFKIVDNGSKIYFGDTGANVTQVNLATAWDLSSTRTTIRTVDVGTRANGIFWKPDGTVFFYIDSMTDRVYSKTVSTAWDLSTITSTSQSVELDLSTTLAETVPYDLYLSPDGTKLYIVGPIKDTIFQCNLSTAWDITSFNGAADKELSVSTQELSPLGIDFSPDGTHMYIAGSSGDGIDQYVSS